MKLKYLGHAAYLIESSGYTIIIDPFISGNPENGFEVEDFKTLDYIFVTHGHGDHLGDTIELAKMTGATVIANFEIVNYLSGYGLECHPMHIGGRFLFPFGRVKMVQAVHGSSIPTDKGPVDGGNPCGFVIDINGKVVYHAGDTGLTMDMMLLETENIDVALLPIGGNFTMDIEDAIRAAAFIKPKTAIPMHYNTFGIIEADPNEFVEGLSSCEGIVLPVGEIYEF